MHTKILVIQLPGLSPSAKYFLLKSIQVFGERQRITGSVFELCDVLGVTDRVTRTALELLVTHGYMERVSPEVGKRKIGRPKCGYAFSPKLGQLLAGQRGDKRVINHELICHLLLSEAFQRSLKTPHKLFLLTLIAAADECGVVRGLGVADLMKLTGMSRDRIGYQMESLKQQGYIRSRVSGVTMPSIFGAASGYIFLNLFHRSFKRASGGRTLVLYLANVQQMRESPFREAQWICEVSRAKQEMPGTDNFESLAEYFGYRDEPKKLIKFFDVITGRQRVYLQVRLNDYASHLLSNFWGEVKDLNSDSDVIFDRIYADVSRMAVSFQKEVEAEELRLLARFLFCVSLRIAKNAQRFVTFAESHSYKGIKCSILPYTTIRLFGRPGYTLDLCIEVFSSEMGGDLGYVKLVGQQFEKTHIIDEKGKEEDLTLETRRNAGLIS